MAKVLLSIALLALTSVHINAQYGDYADYGKGKFPDEGIKGGIGGGPGFGKGFVPKEVYPVKVVGIKPAVVKPPIIPFVKPVIKSYQKFPGVFPHGGYGGKLIPITKLIDYQPKVDITQFIRPYSGAHLLQKHGKGEQVIKHAPPVFIKQPPIVKTIIQDVFVNQPVIVKEQPVIHKDKEITIKKLPSIVKINKKAPVDVKDFGKTAVVKDVIGKPVVPDYGGVKDAEIPKETGYDDTKLE